MKKIITGAIVIILIIVGIFYFSKKSEPVSQEPIKIGVVAPLTGSVAFLGEGLKNAVDLAKESLKDTRYNYDVIFEDSQLDPKLLTFTNHPLLYV